MKRGVLKRAAAVLAVAVALAGLCAVPAAADSSADLDKPYDTYNYSLEGNEELPSPEAYLPGRVLRGAGLAGGLKNPRDLFVDADSGTILIADTDNNRVVLTDAAFGEFRVISTFTTDAGEDALKAPEGVCLAPDGLIYVADTGNKRIAVFTAEGAYAGEIPAPKSPLLGEDFNYAPEKVAVSGLGNIYVLSEGVYEGILEISRTGEFLGYAGMNNVSPSLWDRFWRAISTRRQKKAMVSFIPVSFTNICIDEDDFILATTEPDESSKYSTFRRLNPSGHDVRRNTASVSATGDLGNIWKGKITGQSVFVDITSLRGGVTVCLDSKRSRLFLYDRDGYLMTVFGYAGLGQDGLTTSPAAVDHLGDTLYVLDSPAGSVTEYRPTEYGSCLLSATTAYNSGDYENATRYYGQLHRLNSNSELAYTGIGKAQLREGRYKDAMTSFRLANNKTLYSRAFAEYRRELFSRYFVWIFAAVAAGVVAVIVGMAVSKRRRALAGGGEVSAEAGEPVGRVARYFSSVEFAFYCMFRPFKGTNDLKREKRGTLAGAFTWVALYTLTVTESGILSGYLFRSSGKHINSLLIAAVSVVPILLWCVANWCVTTLTDGEGSFRDIFISAAYSLAPFVMIQIPLIAVSNLLTLDEAGFYWFFYVLSVAWTVLLLVVGNMQIHDVSMSKAILTVLLTVLGMAIILFLTFLVVNLVYTVFQFGRTIYREIIYRV